MLFTIIINVCKHFLFTVKTVFKLIFQEDLLLTVYFKILQYLHQKHLI